MSILNHLDAGYPILAVETFDDSTVLAELREADRQVMTFSAAMILTDSDGEATPTNWQTAFMTASKLENAALMVRDCNHVLANAPIYRALLDCCAELKSNGAVIVLVAPNFGQLPAELQHVVPIIRDSLPTREALRAPLANVAEAAGIELNGNVEALLDAAAGLTIDEAENAYALSLVESGSLEAATVQREKTRTINSTGFLTVEAPRPLSDIGGLGCFKSYVNAEVIPNSRDIQLQVRGVLLCGLPGTGKSLASKVVGSADMLNWPIVRLDVGACKGGLVGQSEANIRNATKIIEAIAPCVLWIDEIEKAVGGFKSSAQTDGGTTLGMVGHLLTWLQEHSKPIFTVATCNNFQALPTELTRSGRFDERFCIDLPTAAEREAIAVIHLNRFSCEYSIELPGIVAASTADYSGAEIEQVVKSAARLTSRKPTAADIKTAVKSVKPLAAVDKTAVTEFRSWARKTLRRANDIEQPILKAARKVKTA